jgi:ribosomal-protein-alanine N-acetyltransferase
MKIEMSAETPIIRDCRKSDIQSVEEIERSSCDDPYSIDLFVSLLESDAVFKVVEVRNTVVGYFIHRSHDGWLGFRTRNKATLISLAVRSDWRKKGIASIMLEDAIRDLKTKQTKSIVLQVRINNEPAKLLYSKFGFKVVRKIMNYYGTGKDGLVMMLDL